jgi:hypothetical protein
MVRGIICVAEPNTPVADAVLQNPNVSGVSIRAGWDFLQPGYDDYHDAWLEGQIDRIAAAGKTVTLSLGAGRHSPGWLYEAGAEPFAYQVPADLPGAGPQRMPLPWDRVFLDHWTHFIQRLGQRYAGHPAVRQVKVGIHGRTEETILPHEPADVGHWPQAGYTPARVLDAYRFVTAHWATAFPGAELAVMVDANSFPNVGGTAAATLTRLIDDSIQAYPGRFVLQTNSLGAKFAWPLLVSYAPVCRIAWQMVWRVTDDPTWRAAQGEPHADGVAGVADVLGKALDLAIAHQARYVEVMPADCVNPAAAVQAVLAQANARLLHD